MKALITGASSGIGEAYAHKFAQMGYDLILTARRADLLQGIITNLIAQYPIKAEVIIAELANNDDLEMLAEKIRQTHDLHVLVNNAGFGSHTHFLEEDFENLDKMISVHVRAPLKLAHAALPQMVKRGSGILINVSSLGSRTPFPKSSVYTATKSYLQAFSETLYLETHQSNIIIQTLCPGFTKTNFHGRMGLKAAGFKASGLLSWMTPEEVVGISLRNLKKGKILCVPGFWNKFIWFAAGALPRSLYFFLVKSIEKMGFLNKGASLA